MFISKPFCPPPALSPMLPLFSPQLKEAMFSFSEHLHIPLLLLLLGNVFSSFFPLADAFSFFIFIDLISRLKLASFSTWYSSLLGVLNTYCYLMRVGYPECAAIYLVYIICFLNTFSSSLNFFDNIFSISLQLPLQLKTEFVSIRPIAPNCAANTALPWIDIATCFLELPHTYPVSMLKILFSKHVMY